MSLSIAIETDPTVTMDGTIIEKWIEAQATVRTNCSLVALSTCLDVGSILGRHCFVIPKAHKADGHGRI
jgi:hypothetical protein